MTNTKRSALQIFTSSIFIKIVNFIGSVFLARILFPEDYGYLLIAMIFSGFVQMFGNMGFENFYLQEKIENKEHEKEILNVTFRARLIVNVALFLIQFLLSFIIEYYLNNTIVAQMLRIYAVIVLISIVTQINVFILRKKVDFKPESYANMTSSVFDVAGKLIFASLGLGALSFALSSVISNLVKMVVILKYQRFTPNLKIWNKKIFKKVYFFGKHSFLTGIFGYFGQETDKIIISTFFPVKRIGEYSFADSQSNTIFSFIIFNQGNLLLSLAAKYKENKEQLRDKLILLSYAIAIFSIPLSISLSYYGYELITGIFGNKWSGSVEIFSLFMIKLMFISFTFPFIGLLTGFGHPEIRTKIVIYRTVVIAFVSLVAIIFYRDLYLYAWIYSIITIFFVYYQAYRGMLLMDFDFRIWIKYSFFAFTLILLSFSLLQLFDIVLESISIWGVLLKIILMSIIYALFSLIVFNHILREVLLLAVLKEHKIISILEKFNIIKTKLWEIT